MSENNKCFQCFQPLKFEENLSKYKPNDLTLTKCVNNEEDSDSYFNEFVFISDEEIMLDLSKNAEVHVKLYEHSCDLSTIDHQICNECTSHLHELLDEQIKLVKNDYYDYCRYLKNIKDDTQISIGKLETELKLLNKEEQQLIGELVNIEIETTSTIKAINDKKNKTKSIDINKITKTFYDTNCIDDEYQSVEYQLAYNESKLKTMKIDVFNTTFHISITNHVGIINNFRLGRLATERVEWSEINSAWGQTVLLLSSLAKKVNLTFNKYKLIPYGTRSYIEVIDGEDLHLYGNEGFRIVWDRKFDSGMIAFLDCLQQFKNKVQMIDGQFSLPYKINNSCIDKYCIKIQFNTEEVWTMALKCVLTNLKWCLAWIASQSGNKSVL